MRLELNKEDDYEILLEYFHRLKYEKEGIRWSSIHADEEYECYLVEECINVLIEELWDNKQSFYKKQFYDEKDREEKERKEKERSKKEWNENYEYN